MTAVTALTGTTDAHHDGPNREADETSTGPPHHFQSIAVISTPPPLLCCTTTTSSLPLPLHLHFCCVDPLSSLSAVYTSTHSPLRSSAYHLSTSQSQPHHGRHRRPTRRPFRTLTSPHSTHRHVIHSPSCTHSSPLPLSLPSPFCSLSPLALTLSVWRKVVGKEKAVVLSTSLSVPLRSPLTCPSPTSPRTTSPPAPPQSTLRSRRPSHPLTTTQPVYTPL